MSDTIDPLQSIPVQTPLYAVKKIAEGDTLKVKVLKNIGGENYLVSLGGTRVSVKSRLPLSEGDTFRATVEISNGKILLRQEFLEEEQIGGTKELQNFLLSLGFASEPSVIKIVQLMIQSGVKIDKSIIQKAKTASLAFPGKEEKAAEIASFLLEKGIEPTEETIKYFILLAENSFTQDSSNEKQEQDEESETNPFATLFSSFPKEKAGLLAFINHLKAKDENGKHWIILPYTWTLGEEEAKGLIRVLLDLNLKTTEKINITFTLRETKRFFTLYFSENDIKKINFFTQPELDDSNKKKAKEKLESLLGPIKVTYSSTAFSDGILSDNTNLPSHFEDSV